MNQEESIRLNKYISDSGYCSRREADRLIDAGKVSIDGKKAGLGDRVFPGQKVTVDGEAVGGKKKSTVWIALNKPVGIECSATSEASVIEYVGYHERIFYVGRLDKESEGLLLLTNDGDNANKLAKARNKHEKEYIVKVNKDITKEFIEKMKSGVRILDTVTRPCIVRRIDKRTFAIILTQGLNRQIRRMCQALGYKVQGLQRIRIMNITLEGIPYGEYRILTKKEVNTLMSGLNKGETGE